ncbi:MAG: alpha/beta hydrolase [Promethearchaeota archaeon]|jgi:hypothetical protein
MSERYVLDNFHAKSLENNPLNSPVERDLSIYLPPGYFQNKSKRYPVIYLLHGYGGTKNKLTLTRSDNGNKIFDLKKLPKETIKQIDTEKALNFEKLDQLILQQVLKQFILVQPDGSLYIPIKGKPRYLNGNIEMKGGWFVNSEYAGNYMDYIVNDVISYMDDNYRTIPDKQHRAIFGGSAGGHGSLFICLHHPEKFIATASINPALPFDYDLLPWEPVVPLLARIVGKDTARKMGKSFLMDVFDTIDIMFSKENPFWPTVHLDKDRNIIDYNKEAFKNWEKINIINLINEKPDSLKQIHIYLTCSDYDEHGFHITTNKIHSTLLKYKIKHRYEVYTDPKIALSPHIFGIASKILPAIQFCLQHIL